jgi:hypothetical protein
MKKNKNKSSAFKYVTPEEGKILLDLVQKACDKTLKVSAAKLKKIYDECLFFEDSEEQSPKYIQTVLLPINGCAKDAYDLLLN